MYQDMLINKQDKDSGYSLVEILVAMLIFGAVVLTLSLPMYSSFELAANDAKLMEANTLTSAYIKQVEKNWLNSQCYDDDALPEIDDTFTANGKYEVTVTTPEIIATSSQTGKVLIKRISITYRDDEGKVLSDVYFDFNRPQNNATICILN